MKNSHNTEKDLEKPELSFIADRNGHWCNYFRQPFGIID